MDIGEKKIERRKFPLPIKREEPIPVEIPKKTDAPISVPNWPSPAKKPAEVPRGYTASR